MSFSEVSAMVALCYALMWQGSLRSHVCTTGYLFAHCFVCSQRSAGVNGVLVIIYTVFNDCGNTPTPSTTHTQLKNYSSFIINPTCACSAWMHNQDTLANGSTACHLLHQSLTLNDLRAGKCRIYHRSVSHWRVCRSLLPLSLSWPLHNCSIIMFKSLISTSALKLGFKCCKQVACFQNNPSKCLFK